MMRSLIGLPPRLPSLRGAVFSVRPVKKNTHAANALIKSVTLARFLSGRDEMWSAASLARPMRWARRVLPCLRGRGTKSCKKAIWRLGEIGILGKVHRTRNTRSALRLGPKVCDPVGLASKAALHGQPLTARSAAPNGASYAFFRAYAL